MQRTCTQPAHIDSDDADDDVNSNEDDSKDRCEPTTKQACSSDATGQLVAVWQPKTAAEAMLGKNVLVYTGHLNPRLKSEYIKRRAAAVHGKTVAEAVLMSYTTVSGQTKPYLLTDVRYDIKTGYLRTDSNSSNIDEASLPADRTMEPLSEAPVPMHHDNVDFVGAKAMMVDAAPSNCSSCAGVGTTQFATSREARAHVDLKVKSELVKCAGAVATSEDAPAVGKKASADEGAANVADVVKQLKSGQSTAKARACVDLKVKTELVCGSECASAVAAIDDATPAFENEGCTEAIGGEGADIECLADVVKSYVVWLDRVAEPGDEDDGDEGERYDDAARQDADGCDEESDDSNDEESDEESDEENDEKSEEDEGETGGGRWERRRWRTRTGEGRRGVVIGGRRARRGRDRGKTCF